MFQTTRRRLALWYTSVTAVLLIVFASAFYLYVRTTLVERIDDTLSHVVEVVERSLVIEPEENGLIWTIDGTISQRVNVEASFRNNGQPDDDDRIDIEWFNPEGRLLWSTFAQPSAIPLQVDQKGRTVQVDRQESYGEPLVLRQVTDRVQVGRQLLGYLRVSHPWFEVTKPTRQLVIDLSIWLVAMVSAVAGIGWLLSGLAMRPIGESYQRLKQFTADASHELRNPIAIIQTNVQAALADPDPDPIDQQQQLQVVERLTRRLGRLVDDLLFLARQDSSLAPQWTSLALDELLLDVIQEQTARATEQHLSLDLQLPSDESLTLQGNPDQLARLFTNLISNAIAHTTIGQIQVRLTSQEQSLRGRMVPTLVVQVEDSGIGISDDALPHIFERFYRVDPARSRRSDLGAGSGLGLAIVQTIVESHQGQIQVSSTVGKGSCFTVVLPC
jgi:two-component system, OmpR family, manganese sensing sensor histidine kinase